VFLQIRLLISAVALWLTLSASADSKIKTRTTMMGNTSEGTTYIKGARERTETSMPFASASPSATRSGSSPSIPPTIPAW
jgi:hypothetical protein